MNVLSLAMLLFMFGAGAKHSVSPSPPHARFSCEDGAYLRSPATATPAAEVVIYDPRPSRARVYWVDSNGSLVFYGTIEPGGSLPFHSFLGHVFRIDDESGHCMTTLTVSRTSETLSI